MTGLASLRLRDLVQRGYRHVRELDLLLDVLVEDGRGWKPLQRQYEEQIRQARIELRNLRRWIDQVHAAARPMTLVRSIELTPAFDRRDADPSKNFGIHGVDLHMALKGPEGAVVFILFTNWMLPAVTDAVLSAELLFDESEIRSTFLPLHCVQIHSTRPLWEGREPSRQRVCGPRWLGVDPVTGPIIEPAQYGDLVVCEYTEGQPCYPDSSSDADQVYELLLREGSDGVWRELERRYVQTFPPEARA